MNQRISPADERSIAALTRTLYAAISGPAGAPRDWKTYRQLFAPAAQLTVVHRGADGDATYERLDVETYRATREPYFASHDFHEIEHSHEVVVEGGMALVASRYASYRAPGGEPFDSGVNGLLLARAGAGWRVVSMIWEAGVAAAEVGRLAAAGER